MCMLSLELRLNGYLGTTDWQREQTELSQSSQPSGKLLTSNNFTSRGLHSTLSHSWKERNHLGHDPEVTSQITSKVTHQQGVLPQTRQWSLSLQDGSPSLRKNNPLCVCYHSSHPPGPRQKGTFNLPSAQGFSVLPLSTVLAAQLWQLLEDQGNSKLTSSHLVNCLLSSCTSISQLLNSFSSFLMAACTEREIFLERKGLRLQQPPRLSQSINTKLNLISPSGWGLGNPQRLSQGCLDEIQRKFS